MPGGSWITGTLGYISIVTTWAYQIFMEQGIPKDKNGWVTFILGNLGGLIGIFAKDFNKSNAPAPISEAKTIPPVS